jgi:hypothetical protein
MLGRNSFQLRLFAEKRARWRAEQGLANYTPDAKSKKRIDAAIAAYKADNPSTPRLTVGDTLEVRRDAAGLIRTMFSRDRGIAFDVVRDRARKIVALKTRPLKDTEGLH